MQPRAGESSRTVEQEIGCHNEKDDIKTADPAADDREELLHRQEGNGGHQQHSLGSGGGIAELGSPDYRRGITRCQTAAVTAPRRGCDGSHLFVPLQLAAQVRVGAERTLSSTTPCAK